MTHFLDAFYLFVLCLLSPWIAWRAWRTRRYRRGWSQKLLGLASAPSASGPVVWFHGVSVGEVHLLRQLVAAFRRRHPDWVCVVSTTTETGFDEARKWFPDLFVFFFPFDFSWAVRRTIRTLNPSLVVLAEAELWPNFLRVAKRAHVPVAVVNGRMSPRSLVRYRRLGPLARWLLEQPDLVAVQTQDYADAVRSLGVDERRVAVTGNIKYDGAATDRANARTQAQRELFAIGDGELVLVAGSTQPVEEDAILEMWPRLRERFPNLRLVLVPRQQDRFGPVAELLRQRGFDHACMTQLPGPPSPRPNPPGPPSRKGRGEQEWLSLSFSPLPFREGGPGGLGPAIILIDKFGELSAAWGLADVAYVGGSLDGQRGGQNMIEPAAYAAAVLFGPHTWNFREEVRLLLGDGAASVVRDAADLEAQLTRLLADADERARMGKAAREFVLRQQGATGRTLALLDGLLLTRYPDRVAA